MSKIFAEVRRPKSQTTKDTKVHKEERKKIRDLRFGFYLNLSETRRQLWQSALTEMREMLLQIV